MRSNRDLAQDVLAELLEVTSAERILNYLVVNYLPGTVALEGLKDYKSELFGEEDEEEELVVSGSSWRDSEDFFDEDDEDYNSALLYGVDNNQ